jgi:tetratricopeptide (TPR) repeat protein
LVSADFLDSDFIMEQELPELIRRRVRLASVLVGDCLWEHVPELASVKWLHDPGRDGALNLDVDPGQRDRRLREICVQLIALAPQAGESRSLSYDPLSLPAYSPLRYDPPPPADRNIASQSAIDSGYVEWAAEGAVQLGLLLAEKGIVTGARAAYERAIDSGDPEWAPVAALLLGVLLAKQGDTANARAAYQRAIESGHVKWAPEAAAKLRQLK